MVTPTIVSKQNGEAFSNIYKDILLPQFLQTCLASRWLIYEAAGSCGYSQILVETYRILIY